MDDFAASTYGDRIADVYDDIYAEVPFSGDVSTTVAFLRDLAGDGPMLELGIGTGRVALPLREAGVDVAGIDASRAMVAKLATKPGGDGIAVTIGDFAEFDLGRRSARSTSSSTRSSDCSRRTRRYRASAPWRDTSSRTACS